MGIIDNLSLGFGVAFAPLNLGFAFIGVMIGTLIGVLPGLGPLTTMAMLLPVTYYLPPESSLIMLAGIYYGAQYGGRRHYRRFLDPRGDSRPQTGVLALLAQKALPGKTTTKNSMETHLS